MKKYLWEILVPTAPDDFSLYHHKLWDTFVLTITDGLTICRTSKGKWLCDNTMFEERMIPVKIMCTKEEIKKIVAFTIKHYRQKAVMYYRISKEVRIIHAS